MTHQPAFDVRVR